MKWIAEVFLFLLVVLPFLVPFIATAYDPRAWRMRILVGWDQLFNTFFGGDPDETISSRVGRGAVDGKRRYLVLEFIINCLAWAIVQEWDHCRESIGS